jgi:hypothetical protein
LKTHQVVSKELHDQSGVLVGFLAQGIQLSNGIIESLLGQMASLVWGVVDLVVEHGEVECKTETDWVGWGEIGLSNIGGALICLEGLVCRLLALIANGELSQVTVVITLPITLLDP